MQNRGNYANRHNLIQIPIQTNINLNSRPSFTRSQTNVLHKLKIAHLNIRSLRNTSHLIETKELVKSHKIDVLTMSETWLNSSVTNGEIAIDDYKIFRQDRLHKKGGGVCAFVKKVLKVTIINELTNISESNFQQLWIKLQNKKMKTIIICVIYRPPDCPLNCIQDDLGQNYVRALSMNKPIFILGDMNCNLLKDCPEKRAITDLCNDLNLKQIIKEPTRITDTSQSLIDVILVSTEAVVLESGVLDSAISDHFPIYVSTKLKVPKTPPTYITVRSYKNYDPTAFSSDLAMKSDRLLSIFTETDVNTKTEVLKDVIQSTLDLHAPIKTIKIRSRSNTFVTPDMKELMKSRNKLHQRFLKTRCKRDWEMYTESRKKVKVMLKEAEINHLADEVKVHKNNPGSLWKIINKTIPVKEKEKQVYTKDLKSIVEDFNNYFTSVGKNHRRYSIKPGKQKQHCIIGSHVEL